MVDHQTIETTELLNSRRDGLSCDSRIRGIACNHSDLLRELGPQLLEWLC